MRELPTGTVTLLFADIEDSTRLLQQAGERYPDLLQACRSLLRAAFTAFNGYEVDTQGDSFFVVFTRASDAVAAAVAAQRTLHNHPWPEGREVRVRMGLHTGEPQRSAEGYIGLDVHHAALMMHAGHGGQVLLSQTTRALMEQALPEGVSLLDLGSHRLKDLQQSARLSHLVIDGLPADFPLLKTLDSFPNNLPVQPTPFIGREREVAAVTTLLWREEVRLLTLTGAGGSGKTRLGLQVAAELSDHFADGVYFVNLAPLSDPDLVIPTVAQALDVKEWGARPLSELLPVVLREKQMLLLLDNFEQVVSAAVQVAALVAACPKVKLMVTSRMALCVRAEQEFAVLPLALPDPKRPPDLAALSQYEAVALFIARAQAVKPEFQLTNENAPAVTEICVRLDGLPLAIELAAARIKLFPPPALLARLDQRLAVLTGGPRDAPARQQTLRHTIAWSYRLLDAREQQLFRQLSVFVGGCTLETIEAVCMTPGDKGEIILDDLTSLIDKNLVRQIAPETEEPRLTMLETIREYGLEMLAASGEMETMRLTHAIHYLASAEKAELEFEDLQRNVWSERLEREYDNLRAILEWSLEPRHGEETVQRREMGLQLAGMLRNFWVQHGWLNEGRTFLQKGLTISTGATTAGRAKALIAAADLAFVQGDTAAIHPLAQEARVLCQQLGDRGSESWCLYLLGLFAANQNGEYAQARSLLEEGIALARQSTNKDRLGWLLWALGGIHKIQAEYTRACACYEEALAIFREVGDRTGVAEMFLFLGSIFFEAQWDLVKARSLLDEGLTRLRKMPQNWFNKWLLEIGLNTSAEIALSQNNLAAVRSLAEETLALLAEIKKERQSLESDMVWTLSLVAQVETRQGNYTTAQNCYNEILTIARAINDQMHLPIYLKGLAEVAAMQGELTWAARLLGAAEAVRDTTNLPLAPVYVDSHECLVATIGTRLGEQMFAIARAEGRTMTIEQVLGDVGRAEIAPPISADQAPAAPAKRSPTYPAGLTAREVEVLCLVAQGMTDAQVAERLVISPSTVNSHLKSIYGKLQVSSRSAATRFAIEHGLV